MGAWCLAAIDLDLLKATLDRARLQGIAPFCANAKAFTPPCGGAGAISMPWFLSAACVALHVWSLPSRGWPGCRHICFYGLKKIRAHLHHPKIARTIGNTHSRACRPECEGARHWRQGSRDDLFYTLLFYNTSPTCGEHFDLKTPRALPPPRSWGGEWFGWVEEKS